MEQKSKRSEQPKQRSNDVPGTDVGPDKFATILTGIFVMSVATTKWKGPRCLAYDTYDAQLRSFLYVKIPAFQPNASSTAGFFYSGKTQCSLLNTQNMSSYTILNSFFSLATGTSDNII